MRTFLCLSLVLFTATPPEALAKAFDQENHRRIVFRDEYADTHIVSTYSRGKNNVTFRFCKGKICEIFASIEFDKLSRLEGPMLKMLHSYRDKVAKEANSSIWYFLSRFGQKSKDAKGIDEIIKEIETYGLANWVQITDENFGKDAPTLSTPAFTQELVGKMKKVLEQSPLEMPGDCPPSA